MSFKHLGLGDEILFTVSGKGHNNHTPVQKQAIAAVLGDRNLMGCSATSTGKTDCFIMPLFHNSSNKGHRSQFNIGHTCQELIK